MFRVAAIGMSASMADMKIGVINSIPKDESHYVCTILSIVNCYLTVTFILVWLVFVKKAIVSGYNDIRLNLSQPGSFIVFKC